MPLSFSRLIRTDLAIELRPKTAEENGGIRFRKAEENGVSHSTLTVVNRRGEISTGKPKGTYITLETGSVWLDEEAVLTRKTAIFTRLLRRLVKKTTPQFDSIFVACLGNAAVTADSLGPSVQNALHISRHLESTPYRSLFGPHTLSALSPGVTGQTGIETLALIKSAVSEVKPSLIIAIDALAARSPDRLCTTVQLCNTGIAPGSGIGNRRCAINEETLGVPVIAIGVPTLVDSSTLLADAFESLGIDEESPDAAELLDPDRHFFVTRNETDLAVGILASMIATSINRLAEI